MTKKKILIIGGGAAGYFAAIEAASIVPDAEVVIAEKSSKVLSKVKVSGGGRCNTTHACFDNRKLISFYPRGGKALLGPFSRFTTTDTVRWFSERGVELKTEEDGRMFPVTDSSETIIDCLLNAANHAGVTLLLNHGLTALEKSGNQWKASFATADSIIADAVIITAGSSNSIWHLLNVMNVSIVPPVPSLFTLHVPDKKLHDLSGLSVGEVVMQLEGTKLQTEGPLLITHWGFSGPATLKLSAWAARELAVSDYVGRLRINYVPSQNQQEVLDELLIAKKDFPRKLPRNTFLFEFIPKRLWEYLLMRSGIEEHLNWADLSNKQLNKLKEEITAGIYPINGKSTFKEEFVTCGGVDVDGIDLKTMQSRNQSGLFFGGEVVNIDAVTGGFNFQWAWTSGYIAANGVKDYLNNL